MILNKEELLTASILTALISPFPYAWAAIPICAFLWAWTGAGASKLWRRLVVPLIWAACLMDLRAFLIVPVAFGFLSLGYGIPDDTDEGSFLGRFFYGLFPIRLANILTRGVVYGGATIPFLVLRIW